MPVVSRILYASIFVAIAAGCTGVIGEGGTGAGLGSGMGPGNELSADTCTEAASPRIMPRLTRAQYDNTVRDLLGDVSRPADRFVVDENGLGFVEGAQVKQLVADELMQAAEALAATAIGTMSTLLPCDPTADEDGCATQLIATLGKRAFRRPLEDGEMAAYEALYQIEKADFGFAAAIETLVAAFLQSPSFLYLVELDRPTLSPYEIATRLSYFLWNTMPDALLMQAADEGRLADRVAVEAEARRMLADPRAYDALEAFGELWLDLGAIDELSKDPTLYPEFDAALAAAMREETTRFIRSVVLEGDGRFETLLTSPASYANADLAALYGVTGASGEELVPTMLPEDQRFGILTQASVLAVHALGNQSSPIHRGKFVRERLLCQPLSPPPNGVEIVPPELDPTLTTRERFAQHRADPVCAACHDLIDPIGFGFENYDAIGRFRTVEAGQPIDSSGELMYTADADGAFVGVGELAARLAGSEEVRACFTTHWLRYALGRAEVEGDACTRARALAAFTGSGNDVRELLVALAGSEAFRMRGGE